LPEKLPKFCLLLITGKLPNKNFLFNLGTGRFAMERRPKNMDMNIGIWAATGITF
jgi:hypothetical protein